MLKGVASSILGENAGNEPQQNESANNQPLQKTQTSPNNNALQSLNSLGLDNLDFNMIMKAKSIFDKMNNTPNKNVDLIMALKPHLRPETQNKADQALKIIKLFEVLPLLRELFYMAYFSENDINEAKRRVSDMQKRANRLTNQEESVKEPPKKEEKNENKNILKDENEEEKDDSSLIILALIMLLSHEGADNMLILALLYLLF